MMAHFLAYAISHNLSGLKVKPFCTVKKPTIAKAEPVKCEGQHVWIKGSAHLVPPGSPTCLDQDKILFFIMLTNHSKSLSYFIFILSYWFYVVEDLWLMQYASWESSLKIHDLFLWSYAFVYISELNVCSLTGLFSLFSIQMRRLNALMKNFMRMCIQSSWNMEK